MLCACKLYNKMHISKLLVINWSLRQAKELCIDRISHSPDWRIDIVCACMHNYCLNSFLTADAMGAILLYCGRNGLSPAKNSTICYAYSILVENLIHFLYITPFCYLNVMDIAWDIVKTNWDGSIRTYIKINNTKWFCLHKL